jgi:spermidine synthase
LRCDFESLNEVVAFVGHNGSVPLPASVVDDAQVKLDFLQSNGRADIYSILNPQTALVYYAGNITASKERFADYPVNTDDKPVIEYMAPKYYRNKGEDEVTPWFVGPFLLKFIKDLQEACPPAKDPLPANQRLPLAGSAFQETKLWAQFGNNDEAQKNWQIFVKEWLDQ